MQQISLFSGLSSSLNLKEIVTTSIKADVKAQVNTAIDLLKDIKLAAYSQKTQGWDADKHSQPHEHKGVEKTEKTEKTSDWKDGISHKGGDTLDQSIWHGNPLR